MSGPRKRRFLALMAACAITLSGCWQAEEPESVDAESPVPLQELEEEAPEEVSALPERFSLPYEQGHTLDPITCPDGMQQVVSSLICQGLFRLSPSLAPENCLCESFTYDPARLVYTFSIRQGVLFSDGSELTAGDVRACLERARTSPRYGARLRAVSRITYSGDTVLITLSAPNTAFPALLDIPICKLDSEGIPIGTGPYAFFREENGAAYLSANPNWWQHRSAPVDRIDLEESQDAMFYRFTSRDVQLIVTDLTGSDAVGISGNVSYQDVASTTLQFIGCNTTRAPLDNASLRRALDQLIDRDGLVSGLLSGHALPTQFLISPASALYPASIERRSVTARVSESGYVPGRTLTMLVNAENPFKVSLASAIAEAFTNGGVPVEIRSVPWEEYLQALAAGDFDFYYGETRLGADWDLSALLRPGGALNPGRWSDERTVQLLDAFAAAEDRAAAATDLCAYLQAMAPILPVCFKNISVLTQEGVVEGLTSTAAEPFYGLSGSTIHLRNP